MSMTNTNPETGIRYGTIYLNSLDPEVANDLFMYGTDLSYEQAVLELKTEILETVRNEILDAVEDGEEPPYDEDEIDDEVDRRLERAADSIQIDEPEIEGECEGVKYAISWLGGAPLLWVFESPVTGHFRLCSPCVPNACDLDSPSTEDGYLGYTVPAGWLRKED